MKKVLFIIISVLTVSGYCNAQSNKNSSNYRQKITVGFKAGANYSNVYDTEGENFVADGKFGLATGVFVGIPLGSFLGIQPEMLFSQKGFKGSGTLLGSNYSYTRTTSYLDVPIFLAFKPSEKMTILAGPQYSYLLSEKNNYTSAITNVSQETQFENDNVRKNTLCLVVGLDVNLSNVVVGLRGGWDLEKNNGDGTSSTPRYKNTWYQATIGFRF